MADVGEEPRSAVLDRYGRLQAREVCECPDCIAAGVEEPPVLVPSRRECDASGRYHDIGKWLHGYDLQRWLLKRREFQRAMHARGQHESALPDK